MTDIINRLNTEADLCRNEGANDIATLLDDAIKEIKGLVSSQMVINVSRKKHNVQGSVYDTESYGRCRKCNQLMEGRGCPYCGYEIKREYPVQKTVYDNVVKHGYREGKMSYQFVAMNLVKCLEEVCEAMGHIETWDSDTSEFLLSVDRMAQSAKRMFDIPDMWRAASLSQLNDMTHELADIVIPVLCIGQELGIDIEEECLKKSSPDVDRGVR